MATDDHTVDSSSTAPQPAKKSLITPVRGAALLGGLLFLGFGVWQLTRHTGPDVSLARNLTFFNVSQPDSEQQPFLAVWWGGVAPTNGSEPYRPKLDQASNIHPEDYAGPESCKECHQKQYKDWSSHAHRWMNALATTEIVKGDFSGNASIKYLGGTGTFYREDDKYRMRLEREHERVYEVHQTIGSRFFQYYVGKQISGPEPSDYQTYQEDHVLPFGYWLDAKEWVPIVHIFEEYPDGERLDPFDFASYDQDFSGYADSCNVCHTTLPLADILCGNPRQMGREAPLKVHWEAANYMKEKHPEVLTRQLADYNDTELGNTLKLIDALDAREHGIVLGVSCEACHLGAKAHVENPEEVMPKFFPHSPYLSIEGEGDEVSFGRTHKNVNWACGRCHTGNRPYFAAGMSTWNSTEYSDAMRGGCYSELRCIDCHDPHTAIGKKWKPTPQQDDAKCVRCHQQFGTPEGLAAHTHHAPGSTGNHCMDCHMPRLNEGLQDVVRTHMIFSPTRPDMIESGQPNACNLCHTDKPIDWTLQHFAEWYGKKYDEQKIAKAYPQRTEPASLNYMKHEEEAVRLVAAGALTRTESKWAMPHLLKALDDPFLLNRQFARVGIERMLDIKLQDHGYRFYQTPQEREEPLQKLREFLAQEAETDSAQDPAN